MSDPVVYIKVTVDVPAAGTPVTLAIPSFSGRIKWSNTVSTSYNSTPNPSYTYPTAGVFVIELQDITGFFSFSGVSSGPYMTQFEYVTRVPGNAWTDMTGAFAFGQTALTTAIFRANSSGNVTSMAALFKDCVNLTSVVFETNTTTSVTAMNSMFENCTTFNQSLTSNFLTANVTTMASMFRNCTSYNQPLPSTFDMKSVTTTNNMFAGCSAFDQSLPAASASTTALTSVEGMFNGCTVYNKALPSTFNLVNVTTTASMFRECSAYNQALPNPSAPTLLLTTTTFMFYMNAVYNQPFPTNFDVRNVTDMTWMLYLCAAFNQDISSFNCTSLLFASDMLNGSGLSLANYSQFLISLANNASLKRGVTLGAGGLLYGTVAVPSRTTLVSAGGKAWNIAGDSLSTTPIVFIRITVNVPADNTSIQLTMANFSGVIKWSDSVSTAHNLATNPSYTYPNAGIYVIELQDISKFQYFRGVNGPYMTQFEYVTRIPNNQWTTMQQALGYSQTALTTAIFRANSSGNVQNMAELFFRCTNLTTVVFEENTTSSVTAMNSMFEGCTAFNYPLSTNFSTAKVTSMSAMFRECTVYNQPLPSSFDMKSVTDVSLMFYNCRAFNQPLPAASAPTLLTNVSNMFWTCIIYNQRLPSTFDLRNVSTTLAMFQNCAAYNQPLPNPSSPTTLLRNTASMFASCTLYNQPFPPNFNTSAVTTMTNMFELCTAFNQDISQLDYSSLTSANVMLSNCGLSVNFYSQFLISLANNPNIKLGVTLNAQNLQYASVATSSRSFLTTTKAWTIAGDSLSSTPVVHMRITVTTPASNTMVTLNLTNFSGIVRWTNTFSETLTSANNPFYIFATAGTNTIELQNITSFGSFKGVVQPLMTQFEYVNRVPSNMWTSLAEAFAVGQNALVSATFRATSSGNVTNMSGLFKNRTTLTAVTFEPHTTISVTNMSEMFSGCTAFNQALSTNFVTSNVSNMNSMFSGCSSFNQFLPSSFDMCAVTTASEMFLGCTVYDRALPNPSVATTSLTNVSYMFSDCTAYKQSLPSNFDLRAVTNTSAMFQNCVAYDKALPNPSAPTTSLVNVSLMFAECRSYNEALPANFDMRAVTTMANMFQNCVAYNKAIPNPGAPTSSLVDVSSMFFRCSIYNQQLPSNFDMRAVTSTANMFNGCSAYDYPLPAPWAATIALTNVASMFRFCSKYNCQLPATFDLRSVTNASRMFQGCTLYDYAIPNPSAPTTSLTNVLAMFQLCANYDKELPANFDMRNVTTTRAMFSGCDKYNHPIPNPGAPTTALTDTFIMFDSCFVYNYPLPSNFDMRNVTTTSGMLQLCSAYNQLLPNPGFPTTALTNTASMFYGCTSYNQAFPTNFTVINVTSCNNMFQLATAFNQNLSNLDFRSLTSAADMLSDCGLSVDNYSQLLISLANNPNIQSNVPLGATGMEYNLAAEASRTTLVTTKGWTITGDSLRLPTINNVCFLAGTPVAIDDVGTLPIERIVPGKHTVGGKAVAHITETISTEDKLVCIDKDALGHNTPSRDIVVSLHHKVLHKGKMVEAASLVGAVSGVYTRKYRGEVLYNVLLADNVHGTMDVCGLTCETLDPTNSVAKLYNILPKLRAEERCVWIQRANEKILAEKEVVRRM